MKGKGWGVMKFRAEWRLKRFLSFFEINLKLIRNGSCLNILELFLDGDGTVLRYQNKGVVCIFKDAIIGRECLEIHRTNQVSRRSYTRTLDYTASDWEPFGLLTTRNNCLTRCQPFFSVNTSMIPFVTQKVSTRLSLGRLPCRQTESCHKAAGRQRHGQSPCVQFGFPVKKSLSVSSRNTKVITALLLHCCNGSTVMVYVVYYNTPCLKKSKQNYFYPRDAMLARVIGIATCLSLCPSVRPSVRPSVTRRYCVKTKKGSGMISSPSDSPKTLVFWRQISSPNSKGSPPPNGGLKQRSVGKIQRFSSFKRQYLENGSRYGKSYY